MEKQKTVILSLHERWWRKMVSGEKLLEIRKTYPHIAPEAWPLRVLVYVTGGVGICGEFTCPHVWKIRTLPEIQTECGAREKYNVRATSCLEKDQLKKYAGESGNALWGWVVSGVQEYEKPVPLESYGIKRPPQSWQYLGMED